MHPDLVAISNVWQRDAAADQLRSELERLKDAVARATAELAAARAADEAAKARLAELKVEERKLGRELDEYVQKRRQTQALIDEGKAPDYDAAQRQVERCAKLIDELEDKGLANLEATEVAGAAAAQAAKALTKAQEGLAEAQAALGAREPGLLTELAAETKARDAAWAELRAEYRGPYSDLRRRKRRVLVNVAEGTCAQCHMRVPPQRMVEVQTSRAVHTCPGCQGYLLP